MGSSFTRYRERGFWSWDAEIELWLYLLAEEVRQLDHPPDWLGEAAEDWKLQATAGFGGCVSAGLDRHASTPERAALIAELAARALARLRGRGEVLTAGWLNFLGLGGPQSHFSMDLPTGVFTAVGEAFIGLLRGQIAWDASTSPVL
jgi:hypothetical protein